MERYTAKCFPILQANPDSYKQFGKGLVKNKLSTVWPKVWHAPSWTENFCGHENKHSF